MHLLTDTNVFAQVPTHAYLRRHICIQQQQKSTHLVNILHLLDCIGSYLLLVFIFSRTLGIHTGSDVVTENRNDKHLQKRIM